MTKPSRIVILAEDKIHQRFVFRFLRERGFHERQIHKLPLPSGRGAGEQWVRTHYADAVLALRARSAKASSALFVVIDADTELVEKRQLQLAECLAKSGVSRRAANEPIVHLIPKRNIETWLLFLTSTEVDEQTDFKRQRNVEGLICPAAQSFHDLVRASVNLDLSPVPSLAVALDEAGRLSD